MTDTMSSEERNTRRVAELEELVNDSGCTTSVGYGRTAEYCAYRAAYCPKKVAGQMIGHSEKTAAARAYHLEKNPNVKELIKLYRNGFLTDAIAGTDAGDRLIEYLEHKDDFKEVCQDMVISLVRDDYNIALGRQDVFSYTADDNGSIRMSITDMERLSEKERRRVKGYRVITCRDTDGSERIEYELQLQDPESAKTRLFRALGSDQLTVVMHDGDSNTEQNTPASKLVAKVAAFAARASASGGDS